MSYTFFTDYVTVFLILYDSTPHIVFCIHVHERQSEACSLCKALYVKAFLKLIDCRTFPVPWRQKLRFRMRVKNSGGGYITPSVYYTFVRYYNIENLQ